MIDIEKAEIVFDNYVKNYDMNNESINRKFLHSHRVKEIAGKIAKSLNFSEEEIKLAKLIGLLHDIARFEQYKRFQTFSDLKSIDHGDYGVEILKQNSFIRKFVEKDEFDSIIFKAIKNHNKFKIEDGLTEKELLFSKIARDADKLDIYFIIVTLFYEEQAKKDCLENGVIIEEDMQQVLKHSTMVHKMNTTEMYHFIQMLCLAFDLNFQYSYEVMYKEDYINKIINRFDFKNKETQEKIKIIRKEINNYIQLKKG